MGLFDTITGLFSTGEGSPTSKPEEPDYDPTALVSEPPGSESMSQPTPSVPQATPEMSLSQRIGLVLIGAGAGLRGDFAAPFEMRMAMDRGELQRQKLAQDKEEFGLKKRKAEQEEATTKRKTEAEGKLGEILTPQRLGSDVEGTLLEAIPHMIAAGNDSTVNKTLELLRESRKDAKKAAAMQEAGKIVERHTDPSGIMNEAEILKEINALGDPLVATLIRTELLPHQRAAMEQKRLAQNDQRIAQTNERIELQNRQLNNNIMNQNRIMAQRMKEEDRRLMTAEAQIRQQERLEPSQRNRLTDSKIGVAMIDDLRENYERVQKENPKSEFLATAQQAILNNAKANTASQLVDLPVGQTQAEKDYAASYNTIIAGVRQLGNEPGVMTDTDAGRLIRSFRATTPDQFRANMTSRRKLMTMRYTADLETAAEAKKDVSLYAPIPDYQPGRPYRPGQQGGQSERRATHRYNPQTGAIEAIQ
jgi:hypothetical protein